MKLIITENCKKTFEGTAAELEEFIEQLEQTNPEEWDIIDSFVVYKKPKELNFNDSP